jgi:hypothetical protein
MVIKTYIFQEAELIPTHTEPAAAADNGGESTQPSTDQAPSSQPAACEEPSLAPLEEPEKAQDPLTESGGGGGGDVAEVGELFQPGEISNPADDLLGDNNSGNTVTNTDVEATAGVGDFTMSLDAALSALVTEATTLASAVANGGATFTTAATTAAAGVGAAFTMEPAARGATSAPGGLPNLSLVSEQLKQAAILSSEQLLGLNSSGDLFSTAPLIQQQQQQMMPEATAVTTTQAAFSFVAGTPQLKVEEENRLLGTPTTTHQQQVGWPLLA